MTPVSNATEFVPMTMPAVTFGGCESRTVLEIGRIVPIEPADDDLQEPVLERLISEGISALQSHDLLGAVEAGQRCRAHSPAIWNMVDTWANGDVLRYARVVRGLIGEITVRVYELPTEQRGSVTVGLEVLPGPHRTDADKPWAQLRLPEHLLYDKLRFDLLGVAPTTLTSVALKMHRFRGGKTTVEMAPRPEKILVHLVGMAMPVAHLVIGARCD